MRRRSVGSLAYEHKKVKTRRQKFLERMEQGLSDSRSVLEFTGLSLSEPIPDETTMGAEAIALRLRRAGSRTCKQLRVPASRTNYSIDCRK